MKAIICEYLWQLDHIDREPDALLISISPDMSYQLSRSGRKFKECSEICLHDFFWRNYSGFVKNSLTLTHRLDEIVREVDPRFRDLDFPIFDRLGYMLKIDHEQSIYYAHMVRELMDLGVDTVVCADNGGPALDEYGMFEAGMSIIPDVVRAFGSGGPALEIQIPPDGYQPKKTPRFSFGQPIVLAKKVGIESLYNAVCDLKYRVKITSTAGQKNTRTVLSVGCKEVDALDENQIQSIHILKYHPNMEYACKRDDWPYLQEYLDRVINDEEIIRLSCYRGANLIGLIHYCVRFFADKLELVLQKRTKIFAFLDNRPVDFVVFQTMAPHYMPNVIVQEWCRKRNVPFACWMHGGYGAYESLQGYDVTDYRLSRQHMVYGQVLLDLQNNPCWVLHKLGYGNNLEQVHVTGSPFFEKLYSGYCRPQNPRKKILFCLGNFFDHNKFNFGHNRANSELSIWSSHKKIIEILAEYQNEYDIIIKDYPHSPHATLWLQVLCDLNAEKIEYICHERPFNEVLIQADLHIFSWVSTTFFQSMYTDADICLFDNSDLTCDSRKILTDQIVFSPDLNEFCKKIRDYLENGQFYTQNKSVLRKYFVDYDNHERRIEQFKSVVSSFF